KGACFLPPVPPQIQPRQHCSVPAPGVDLRYRPLDRVGASQETGERLRPRLDSRHRSKAWEVRMMRPPLDMRKSLDTTPAGGRRRRAHWSLWALCAAAIVVAACSETVIQHGHQFQENDLRAVTSGMSQDQVKTTLGTPTTTAAVGAGSAYYYIST